jgi:hypothetical protein
MTRDELLLRLSLVLSREELDQVARDLESETEESPAWLRHLVRAAGTLPLPAVPPMLSRSLHDMFNGPSAAVACTAELVSDSRDTSAYAGVRGAEALIDWSLGYASSAGDVAVDVWPRTHNNFDLEATLLTISEGSQACRAVCIGPVSERVESDAHGRIRFERLPAGRYTLTLDDGHVAVSMSINLQQRIG